jgi:hypothetical protein
LDETVVELFVRLFVKPLDETVVELFVRLFVKPLDETVAELFDETVCANCWMKPS